MYNWNYFQLFIKNLSIPKRPPKWKIKIHSIFILFIILGQVIYHFLYNSTDYISIFLMFEMYKIFIWTFQINGFTYQNPTPLCMYWFLCLASSSINSCQGSWHSRSLRTLLLFKKHGDVIWILDGLDLEFNFAFSGLKYSQIKIFPWSGAKRSC